MPRVITDDCTACGSCAPECPTNCINEGSPKYVIVADECIDCAACEAVCPSNAIKEA